MHSTTTTGPAAIITRTFTFARSAVGAWSATFGETVATLFETTGGQKSLRKRVNNNKIVLVMECSYLVDTGVGVLAVLDDSVVRLRNG